MSIAADCYACIAGDHDRHDQNWNITPGLIGGSYCDCSGDCAERQAAAFAASPFAALLADLRAAPVPHLAATDVGEGGA